MAMNSRWRDGFVLTAIMVMAGGQGAAVQPGDESPRGAVETCGETWTVSTVAPAGLEGAAWGGSHVVAVGAGGTVLSSPDGVTFTASLSGTVEDLKAVAWSGAQFVAVGDSGAVVTSSDGVAWTVRDGGTASELFAVGWSGSRFVAVGHHGAVVTSPDAVSWTAQASGTTQDLRGVVWTGSRFVAVGDNGTVITSPDGSAWSRASSGTSDDLRGIAWSGSLLVALRRSASASSFLTSLNGLTWNLFPFPTAGSLNAITWAGTRFVAVGTNMVSASPDGSNWETHGSTSLGDLRGVAWSGSQLVGVLSDGGVQTSPDGLAWTTRRKGGDDAWLNAVAWSGSSFVAVGSGGAILTSPDGSAWAAEDSGSTRELWGIASAGSRLVAVGDDVILTSPDGSRWTSTVPEARVVLRGVATSGSQIVAVGSGGTILTSPDGLVWSARSSKTGAKLTAVAWTGARFVAVGESGAVVTSPDGVTWAAQSSGTTTTLNAVATSGAQVVAVGNEGVILTSPDGTTWTSRSSGGSGALAAVVRAGTQFVAGGGPMRVSADGVTWHEKEAGAAFISGLAWSGERIVGVGFLGDVVRSACSGAPPVAGFSYLPATPVAGQEVKFTDESSGTPAVWAWDFGDGGTSSLGSPAHTFATPGPKTVTLSVSNAAGSHSHSQTVTVRSDVRYAVWVPVATHAAGSHESHWRTDLGILNPATETASVELRLHLIGGVLSKELAVPAGHQVITSDVVSLFPFDGSGALEVVADQPVRVSSRTYNLVSATASCPGTFGQNYSAFRLEEGLQTGDAAFLPQLVETVDYRTNIALTNTGPASALVTVTLYDGAGTSLGSFQLTLNPGEYTQEIRPFHNRAGQSNMTRGYARVVVDSGLGILAQASVIDNTTGDPTTISFVRETAGSLTDAWVQVGSHAAGSGGSQWRTDLGILNRSPSAASVEVKLHVGGTVKASTTTVSAGGQSILSDVVGQLAATGSGSLEVVSDVPVIVSSRTFNSVGSEEACYAGGTFGQNYDAFAASSLLSEGQSAWLTQLTENGASRTNIALTNTGEAQAEVTITLYAGGTGVGSYQVTLRPGEYRQETRPFYWKGGQSAMAAGYARVTVTQGSGVMASASVVDNLTSDPTTMPAMP